MLDQLISSVDFGEPYDAQVHREIYNHIENAESNTSVPPSLVFYAARNILFPSFIIGQIPDLLNLLTTIDTLRRFAVLKSEETLDWHTYYELEQRCSRAEDVRLLSSNEIRVLRRFLDKKNAQRREYTVLVRSLVQLYIHYLVTARESCLLAKRLNDCFPGSFQGTDTPSELLFHTDLSEDEKNYFGRLKAECREWINLVADWDSKREETCLAEGISEEDMDESFASDFCATFPQPFEPSEISRNVNIYMNKVEDMIRNLQEWFPASGT